MNKRVFLLKYALPAGLILATGAVALRIMLGGWIPFFATSTPPTGPLSPEQEKIAASLLAPPSQPAVPDDENAADAYRDALALLDAYRLANPSFRSVSDWLSVVDGAVPALGGSTPLGACPVEPIPLSNDGAEPADFLPLYTAAALPCNFGVDWTMGPFTEVPHLTAMRDLALWLALQVRFDVEQSRPQRALKHLAVIFGIAGHLSEEPALISQSIAVNAMHLARRSLMRAAFEMKDDSRFLRDAAALVRDYGSLRTPPEDVITNECTLAVSYYCRLAADPERRADDFTDALRPFVEMVGPLLFERPDSAFEPPSAEQPAALYRHWLEQAFRVPFDSINDRTFRPVVRKMAVVCRKEADVLAAAAGKGPAASRDAARTFTRNAHSFFRSAPQTLFARLFLSSLAHFPLISFKNAAENAAAVQVLDALTRSSRDTGPVLDVLGRECTVTWFDDLVYIESPSQYVAPHDLDMCLGPRISFEDFTRRLRALSSTDALLNIPDRRPSPPSAIIASSSASPYPA